MTTTATNPQRFFGLLLRPRPEAAYTLAFFRMGFGLLMAVSLLRFALKGWIYDLYIFPTFYFPFYGFEWVKPLPGIGMYLVFGIMLLSCLCVAVGWFYRANIGLFFLLFTYVELIDKTNYLNHYYFISLVSFLLVFLPANAVCSLDAHSGRAKQPVYTWQVWALLLQIGSVYFFAGIAKIKPDWLLHAQPLRIWLHANNDLPLIGPLLDEPFIAYAASWFGMLFDVSLPFLLLYRRTRIWAYGLALFFHLFTGVLFHIGMFPYIMMFCALAFFPAETHRKWLKKMGIPNSIPRRDLSGNTMRGVPSFKPRLNSWLLVLGSFFLVQLLLPFRYLLYPGDPFIGEEGFRFSWNVMLMEKNGLCEFRVVNTQMGTTKTVYPHEWLSKQQERMMSTQPDMILQFAHLLAQKEAENGQPNSKVYSDCYVSVNGRGSRRLINPETDLAAEYENFSHKPWILNGQ